MTRRSSDRSRGSVTVTPDDRLVIGFGIFHLRRRQSGAPRPLQRKAWPGGNLPARDPDPASLSAKNTRAQWTDRWCHRSVYSWQIRTTLAAALVDPHQSFTVLPYGCSGATITEGILYGYNGVEWSPASDRGVMGAAPKCDSPTEMCRPRPFDDCASGAAGAGEPTGKPKAQEWRAASRRGRV